MGNIFDGVRVVDFTNNAAGPFATAMLADFGAEIIKIERPKVGDDMRAFPPALEGSGVPFCWLNRGKKSVVLDLTDPAGREIARQLIAKADVVVESFKPGTMESFGLDYDALKKINPSLIMCSVSAYGQTGPYREKPGYDIVAQAQSGVMDLTGHPGETPTRVGIVIADYTTGLYAYSALVTALYHRTATGEGQYIDIALLDSLVTFNGLIESAGIGRKPTRTGNHHGLLAPFGVFNGQDGSIIIGAPNPKMWAALCALMGKPELSESPLFGILSNRIKNLNKMVEEIETWLKTFSSVDQALALLEKKGIPCAKVNSTTDLLTDPQLQVREMITDLETPSGVMPRTIKARGNPMKFSAVKPLRRKAPNLGEHQAEMLQELGYDENQIAQMREKWNIS